MEEPSGRATEDGSLFQDGQMGNSCCVCRSEELSRFTIYKVNDNNINIHIYKDYVFVLCEITAATWKLPTVINKVALSMKYSYNW